MLVAALKMATDTNPTPTRFLLECEDMTPMLSLNLDNPYSPFDGSYKFLNPGTPRPEADILDTDFRAPSSTISMLSQQAFPPPGQHPWSNMVFGEACMPLRQLSPRISPRSSISSNASSSNSTSPLQSPISSAFRSRTSSLASDQLVSHLEATGISTHERNAVFELVSSNKLQHSDLDLPSFAPESPVPDTLIPGDTLSPADTMRKSLRANAFHRVVSEDKNLDYDEQDMSDQHDSTMDVDLNDTNDEDDDEETSSRSPQTVRETPTQTRTSRRVASAKLSSSKPSQSASKSSSRTKKGNTSAKNTSSSSATRKSAKTTSTKNSSRASSTTSKGSSGSRKHPSPDEELPEAKRQRFLERNRMAASKCREKKRLQTLKTIADADEITARNQALHESLDELQEEVRALKNQILCHRDCGCDVIQKFVQSSYGSTSFFGGANYLSPGPSRSQPQLCQ
ncbi:hypothetical protein B0O80DRAFT_434986 [Mortierella sp. GBAus27b]|nr:hypothetical protein BGX31_001247 [Mortierella sp. GBA43]KAI8362067.1 hypothetical protein B0O80DRAFT_434986 [Mortierella sp. GBAus27b]